MKTDSHKLNLVPFHILFYYPQNFLKCNMAIKKLHDSNLQEIFFTTFKIPVNEY